MLEKEINHCIKLYKEKRYEVISDNMITVDSQDVHLTKRKGGSLITCTCHNHVQNADSPAFCRHKLFFIMLPYLDKLNNKISELKNMYRIQKYSPLDKEKLIFMMMEDLDDISRLKV